MSGKRSRWEWWDAISDLVESVVEFVLGLIP